MPEAFTQGSPLEQAQEVSRAEEPAGGGAPLLALPSAPQVGQSSEKAAAAPLDGKEAVSHGLSSHPSPVKRQTMTGSAGQPQTGQKPVALARSPMSNLVASSARPAKRMNSLSTSGPEPSPSKRQKKDEVAPGSSVLVVYVSQTDIEMQQEAFRSCQQCPILPE